MEALRQVSDTFSLGKNTSPVVAIADSENRDVEIDKTSIVSIEATHNSTVMNGHSGVNNVSSVTNTSKSTEITKLEHYDRLAEITKTVKGLILRLDEYDEDFFSGIDLRAYLEYISDERLVHMPRRGSAWDRVLGTAQFFGLQVEWFGRKLERFARGGKSSAAAVLASCQVLLEIGHDQAQGLMPTFVTLYELGMMLSNIAQIRNLESMPRHIKEAAANIFGDLVHLIGSIAMLYRQRISGLKPGSSLSINFDAVFGNEIDQIWRAKEELYDRVWIHSIDRRSFSLSLKVIRQKLQPLGSPSVRNTLYDEVHDHLDRSEDTCTWIKERIGLFFDSGEQVLSITGPAGSGKTVLAEWVQERLARPLDYRTYSVLKYDFPFDSPRQATTLACVKSLLFQLLERSVGNVRLYEQLVWAFEAYNKFANAEKLESALWDTLRIGLQAAEQGSSTYVILTDGCDLISGGDGSALAFAGRAKKCVAGLSRTRLINFSRPVSHLSEGCKQLEITREDVRDDIRVHLRQTLSASRHFLDLEIPVRDLLLEDLTKKSKGNFLWAFYVGRILLKERSCESLVSAAKSMSTEILEVLTKAVAQLDLKGTEMLQHLLSFMLITERPFTIEEVAELLATDLHKRAMAVTVFNISKFITQHCSDFVVIRGGRLHFRSEVVRTYFKGLMGKSLFGTKDAHLQLTLRLLLYARLNLGDDEDLHIDELDESAVGGVLYRHRLMGYVMTNWVTHFRSAGFVASDGEIRLPKGFREIFPESVMFALLERPCWRNHYAYKDLVGFHELTLRIRQTCLGNQHITVLQTLITLGHVHTSISSPDAVMCGARYFYQASKLGEIILSKTHTIVGSCTHLFLTHTETITITERTEIVTYREEMIRVWIQICKHRHGPSSDEVIMWYEKLAKLYIDIHESWRATAVYKELYEIIVIRFGKKSPRARKISDFFGSLDIVLKKGKDSEKDIGELEEFIFETSEELEVTDHLCIDLMIKLAKYYVGSGKVYLAERLFISLWRRFCILCRASSNVELHITKIRIALDYVEFLRECNRHQEAVSILVCLWSEYEHSDFEGEKFVIWIRELGTACRYFGLASISMSIFTRVWGWFKGSGKGEIEEARKTTVLITEFVEEITETTTTTKTTTTTTTEVTETMVKEIYETNFERCKKTKVDSAFFSSCMALVGLYFRHEKWSEAELIIRKTLEVTWEAILTADVNVKLCEHSIRDTVLVARQLARCYRHQGIFEKAENIYLKIYYACLGTLALEDKILCESLSILIDFYEEHHRHEKVIEIYVGIIERYKKNLGPRHHLTIKTLYLLANHCKLIGHEAACKYYLEIVTVLNKDIKHCHHDAFEASLFLCRHYYHRQKWDELREVCAHLWETICHHHHQEFELTEELIRDLYEKFTHVLDVHAKVEFSVLYKITVEYKEVTTKVCGHDSSAYILALIALAKLCETHEKHHHESVTIYEEVIKKITTTKTTTTTITETTVNTVKRRLSKMYVTIITTGIGGSSAPLPFDRAIEICLETFTQLKLEFGVWHEKTLEQLRRVVTLYHKRNTQDTHHKMAQLLQLTIIEIITTVTVTMNLFKAAMTLASMYVGVGLVKEGHELLRQLRHLIIFRGRMPGTDIVVKLDVLVSKVVFVFLSAFEQGLCGKSCAVTYSEIMATIIYESLLYEEYARVIEVEKRVEVILECGSRLRTFWSEQKRAQLLTILDQRLFKLFKAEYSSGFKGIGDEYLHAFYVALLGELSKDRGANNVEFALIACMAGNAKVKELLLAKDWQYGYQVARSVFSFSRHQGLYNTRKCIQYGYKLAEFLAGIDVPHPSDAKSDSMSKQMLELSREIMKDVLVTFRAEKIDVMTLRFQDLAGLIRLLGVQENYGELEGLLSRLWRSREVMQRSGVWSHDTILDIGKLLCHAQYANKNLYQAIDTAELLCYNLRRGRGRLDSETLLASRLLASLYMSNNRAHSAMAVHESILREILSCRQGDEFNDMYPNPQRLVADASLHLELLKSAYHQLKGWTKPEKEFIDLYERVKGGLGLQLPTFKEWCQRPENKNLGSGGYIPLVEWRVQADNKERNLYRRPTVRERRKGRLDPVRNATQLWLVY